MVREPEWTVKDQFPASPVARDFRTDGGTESTLPAVNPQPKFHSIKAIRESHPQAPAPAWAFRCGRGSSRPDQSPAHETSYDEYRRE